MPNTNRFGLPRHIPEDIALEVRQRSKFGCVICRCAIYQYEHIDPEYAEAATHEADNICLLCGGCHDRVTRGRLSKETVKARYIEVQESAEVRRPFEEMDLSTNNLTVSIGTFTFESVHHLIRINGNDLLSITPPKDGSTFPTLNGLFFDHKGAEIFRIIDNVWEGQSNAWDIRVQGKEVTIKSEEGRTALAFRINPPDKLTITHLDMYMDNCHITCDANGILIGQMRDGSYAYLGLGNTICRGARIGIDVDSRGIGPVQVTGVSIVGGEGIKLDGTGIRVGIGAPSMNIRDLKIWNA